MFKILLAVDGSEHASRAIEAVAKLAHAQLDLEATLICVTPEPGIFDAYSLDAIKILEEEQRRRQDAVLDQSTQQARAQGIKLGPPERAQGVIGNEIVRIANAHQFDQIAMGTRGMGAMGSMFLGSVAQRVLHLSTVPVLMVK